MFITKIMLKGVPLVDETDKIIRLPFTATAILDKKNYTINGVYIVDEYDDYLDLQLSRIITELLKTYENQNELIEEMEEILFQAPVLKKIKERFQLFWSNME